MGSEYLLRSSAGEDHVRRVADHFNRRLDEVSGTRDVTSNLAAAVLAALNITNDFLQLKDRQDRMLQEIEAESERLLAKIELE